MSGSASDSQFLIAGGGIAGLATAIALGRLGLTVRVFEKADAFSDEGAGIQLGPNATKILNEWGVLDRLKKLAVDAEGVAIGDGLTGEHLATVPFGETAQERYGSPFLLVHRSDLHKALLETARDYSGFAIEMGHQALSFVQSTDGVSLKTSNAETKGAGLAPGGRALVADALRD